MNRFSLKMRGWPDADRSLWERAVKTGELLEDAGPGADWAAETKRVMARDYGYWLSFVLRTYPLSADEAPGTRLTPDRVRAYCKSMEDVCALTRASRIARLYAVIKDADPSRDLRWLANVRRALERSARREGPTRKRGRVIATGRIVEAGLSLMKLAHLDHQRSFQSRAKNFRDGLMIALLAARPFRIKNFAALRLGHHLRATSSGYLIDIPGEETKTGGRIETFVPEDLCPWLALYLDSYRNQLLGERRSDCVWVHERGLSYRPGSLSQRIAMLTKRHLGAAISPHHFRDCAATTIATDDPEHVLIIAPLLGHTTLRTSESHYNHAHSLEASRRFQFSIKETRNLARSVKRRPLTK